MDKNQIIELWRSLSPRLARGIPDEELPGHELTDEDRSDRDSEYSGVDPKKVILERAMLREGISNAY